MKDQEKRIFLLDNVEVRAEGHTPTIAGYAAVFNKESVDLGGFVEVIQPGAFTRTLATGPDVRATIDHEGGLTTLGRTRNNTLRLDEDAEGLRVEIDLPNTQAGRDALTLVQRGDISQMSFMFMVPQGGDEWQQRVDGIYQRTLTEVDLNDGDVAIVTYPAYPQTSVEARNKAKALTEAGNADADKANDATLRQARQAQRTRELELKKRKR